MYESLNGWAFTAWLPASATRQPLRLILRELRASTIDCVITDQSLMRSL